MTDLVDNNNQRRALKPVEMAEPRKNLEIIFDSSKSDHQQLADASLSPLNRGGAVSSQWAAMTMGSIGVNEACQYVRERAEEASAGNLDAAKQMLMAQAVTLDAIFTEMAKRAASCMRTKEDGTWSISKDSMETCTRIAFKAQGQCRTTLEALGELVNPRSVAFIKQAPGSQANVTQGPQQVVNGTAQAPAHGNTETTTNKLLEANPSERLDFGAKATAGGANPGLETVGAVNRTENKGGKVRSLPERAQAR